MKFAVILTVAAAILSAGIVEVSANQPLSSVSGYVYDSNAKPVGKALIEFTVKTETRGLVSIATRSDETGKYRIERIPAGNGWAKVDAGVRGRTARRIMLEAEVMNVEIFKLQ
jgi:hypothetical protein